MATAPPAKRARRGDHQWRQKPNGGGTGGGCLDVAAFSAADAGACPALGWEGGDGAPSLLAPFCWPLEPAAFLAKHWDGGRAFATQARGLGCRHALLSTCVWRR